MPIKNAIPGMPFAESVAGGMADSFELMKKMWGVAGLPGLPGASNVKQFAQGLPGALPSMIAPTFDVDELDRRIGDLRAVEQWLALNTSMLRTTIQTLEVQRNTIATIKSFSGAMMASAAQGMPPAPSSLLNKTVNKPPLSEPAKPEPTKDAAHAGSPAAKKTPAATPEFPLNAAAWWGALQDQFARLASVAIDQKTNQSNALKKASGTGASSTSKPKKAAARARKSKPAA